MSETDADPEQRVGDLIANKYKLLKLLGAGGMGAVYEAEHSFTHRRVAVKLMHEMFAKSKVLAERFIREARAPGAIGHAGIVEVLDGGYDDEGGLYVVLEMLEGQELSEAYESLSLAEVVTIAAELLDALGAAHSAGFVHRDIKPDNVFLAWEGTQRRVKLLDFGVAGLLEAEESAHLTKTGTVLGTPMFMCPEQAKGERVDHRGDLWAVGAILYDALAGHPPYQGESYNALIVSIVTREHVPLSRVRPDLPRPLLEVIDRALRKDPDKRYQSAEEMAGALRSIPKGDAQSGVVVRRPQQEVATRADRNRGGSGPGASVAGLGIASTRPSEPMPVPAIKLTVGQPATVPSARPRSAPQPQPQSSAQSSAQSQPQSSAQSQPQSSAQSQPLARPQLPRPAVAVTGAEGSGIGIWIAGGLALIAIAIGIVVSASRGETTPEQEAATAATAALVDDVAPTAQPAAAPDPAAPEAQEVPQPQAPEPEPEPTPAAQQPPLPQAPEPAAADTQPPLGTDDLTAVVTAHQAAIQRCYQDTMSSALMAGAEAKALQLHVAFTVAATGNVSTVSVQGDAPAPLARCVEQQVRKFTFRATAASAQLSFPVVFQPAVVGR